MRSGGGRVSRLLVRREPAHGLRVHHADVVIFSISTGSASADAVVDVALGGFQLVEGEALSQVGCLGCVAHGAGVKIYGVLGLPTWRLWLPA
jgi:hypothetical protein